MQGTDFGDRHFAQRAGLAGIAVEQPNATGLHVDSADEIAPASDRPGDRRGVERQRFLDLLDQFERIAAFAVHLIDEGDDRNVAQPADLEQLAGARFDALGGVDHHHRRIDGRKRSISVFREVLVAGRIEQIEHAVVVFERHHRSDDGDAALALDRHPVRPRRTPVALGLDLAGELDGSAEQQELLGQGGLAGIRMRDDRKGAAPFDLRGNGRFWRGAGDGGRGHSHGRLDVAVPATRNKARGWTAEIPRLMRKKAAFGCNPLFFCCRNHCFDSAAHSAHFGGKPWPHRQLRQRPNVP